jgi:hypothetical protein
MGTRGFLVLAGKCGLVFIVAAIMAALAIQGPAVATI